MFFFLFLFLDIQIAKLNMLLDTGDMNLKTEMVMIRIGTVIETMKKHEVV